jgi:hypothetical protein
MTEVCIAYFLLALELSWLFSIFDQAHNMLQLFSAMMQNNEKLQIKLKPNCNNF